MRRQTPKRAAHDVEHVERTINADVAYLFVCSIPIGDDLLTAINDAMCQ
jgi:hypothetical protein